MIGKTFDNRFKVLGKLKHNGGMGDIYFVEDLDKEFNYKIIIKVSNDEYIDRFKKEIKIMSRLSTFPKIAKILYSNLESATPYYIMKFYENGSLQNFYTPSKLKDNFQLQKKVFLEMIEGIQVLHSENKFHRDIKPDNFLIDDSEDILVSDFGLSVDLDSISIRITKTSDALGTVGYYPPEFKKYGSFKYDIDAQSDIYMLGKSFYALLVGDYNPEHIDKSKINNFLYPIIEKACQLKKEERYESLYDLEKALEKVFQYKLTVDRPFIKIRDLCKNNFLDDFEVLELYELFSILEIKEQKSVLKILPIVFFNHAVNNEDINLKYMIEVYKEIVEVDEALSNWGKYPQEFMDRFRESMFILIEKNKHSENVKDEIVEALSLLVTISEHRGEWKCQGILKSITSEELGEKFSLKMLNTNFKNNQCISEIDPSDCNSNNIQKLIIESKT